MMYLVRKGYSYVDINGRNKVYAQGEKFSGTVDPKQKWKLGSLEPEPEKLEKKTKGVEVDSPTDYDEMDEGEET